MKYSSRQMPSMLDLRPGLFTLTAAALVMAASLRAPAPWDMAAVVIAAILGAAAVLLMCVAVGSKRGPASASRSWSTREHG